jgi:abequosyltransferase
MTPILSICIPSYNRPEQLEKLLVSVDGNSDHLEIVICEDFAPKRAEVRAVVNKFSSSTKYRVVYKENEINLGYDGNFRRLIEVASGDFVLFLGDDDWFKAGALDEYISFLEVNRDVGYVLRSHLAMHPDGVLEPFRYMSGPCRLPPGEATAGWLYKRTVSIGGITFNRKSALRYSTVKFDGTLLYQCHLVLEIALTEFSAYSDIPVVISFQSYREDKPNFGAAGKEAGLFTPGKVTPENSINFTKGFFVIVAEFDKNHGTQLNNYILNDLSKYSYPFLSIQRKRGLAEFISYAMRLANETNLNHTWHYYFYTFALAIFGERICDNVILEIKKRVGHTPNF